MCSSGSDFRRVGEETDQEYNAVLCSGLPDHRNPSVAAVQQNMTGTVPLYKPSSGTLSGFNALIMVCVCVGFNTLIIYIHTHTQHCFKLAVVLVLLPA